MERCDYWSLLFLGILLRYSEPVNAPRGRSVMPGSQRQQHGAEERHPYSCSPVHEHERPSNIPVSPRRDVQSHRFDNLLNGSAHAHQVASYETICSPGSRSPGPRSRGYTLSTSPVGSRVFSTGPESPLGKQDDLRNPSHPLPLPLPPGSPTSPASRSLQSKWKKGKLLGRGTFGHVFAGFNRYVVLQFEPHPFAYKLHVVALGQPLRRYLAIYSEFCWEK